MNTEPKKLSRFENQVKYLSKYKKTFETEQFGVQKLITHQGTPHRFIEKISDHSISSVCKAVRRCCINYMNENGMPDMIDMPVKTVYKNREMFEKIHFADDRPTKGIYIDVKGCYWNIMYNLGYIPRRIYMKYYDKKEARNTAIGNLRKRRIKDFYENGVRIPAKQEITENPFKVFNHNIRATAYQYYLDLIHKEEIDTLFYFLTDGYFILDPTPKNSITYKAIKYFHRNNIDIELKRADYSKYNDGIIEIVLTDFYNRTNPIPETKIIKF